MFRAAGEGVAQTPNNLREQNRDECRKESLYKETNAHQHVADDDRQPARNHIGDHTGRHFEDERGDFKGGAHEDQLDGSQSRHRRFVQRGDNEHHREEHRRTALDEEINPGRASLLHARECVMNKPGYTIPGTYEGCFGNKMEVTRWASFVSQ